MLHESRHTLRRNFASAHRLTTAMDIAKTDRESVQRHARQRQGRSAVIWYYGSPMFQAELHGKIPTDLLDREDVLTSNVFGFLECADRRLFLHRFLTEVLVLPTTTSDAEAAMFEFWPTFDDGTEPDVLLNVGGWLLLVEAKLGSTFGVDAQDREKNQLRREIREGRRVAAKRKRSFKLVTITKEPYCDTNRYQDIKEQDREDWIWCNWQAVTALLEQTPPQQRGALGSQLLDILLRRGLRGFRGFDALGAAPLPWSSPLFFDTIRATSVGYFRGFQLVLSGLCLPRLHESIFWNQHPRFAPPTHEIRLPPKVFYTGKEER